MLHARRVLRGVVLPCCLLPLAPLGCSSSTPEGDSSGSSGGAMASSGGDGSAEGSTADGQTDGGTSTGSDSGSDTTASTGTLDPDSSSSSTGDPAECEPDVCVDDDGCCAEGCGPHDDADCGIWAGPDQALECPGLTPRVAVAVDDLGNTTVAQRCGQVLSVARWDVEAGWSAPVVLDEQSGFGPALVANGSGALVLATAAPGEIVAWHYAPGSGWADPQSVATVGGSMSATYPTPRLALDEGGDAVVAFTDAAEAVTGTGVLGALYRGGGWGPSVVLGGGPAGDPDLSVAMAEGAAVVAWRGGDDYDDISIRRTDPDGSTWTPTQVQPAPGIVRQGEVALGPDGLALVASTTYEAGEAGVRIDRHTPTGWLATLQVDAVQGPDTTLDPMAVVGSDGVATVVWRRQVAANPLAEVVRLDGETLGEVAAVDPSLGGQGQVPRIAVAADRTWIAVDDLTTAGLSLVALDPNGHHPGDTFGPWGEPMLAGAPGGHAALAVFGAGAVSVWRFVPAPD